MFALYKEVSYPLTKRTHTDSDTAQNREINFHGLEENNEQASSRARLMCSWIWQNARRYEEANL